MWACACIDHSCSEQWRSCWWLLWEASTQLMLFATVIDMISIVPVITELLRHWGLSRSLRPPLACNDCCFRQCSNLIVTQKCRASLSTSILPIACHNVPKLNWWVSKVLHEKRQVTIKFQWTLPLEDKYTAESDHDAICVGKGCEGDGKSGRAKTFEFEYVQVLVFPYWNVTLSQLFPLMTKSPTARGRMEKCGVHILGGKVFLHQSAKILCGQRESVHFVYQALMHIWVKVNFGVSNRLIRMMFCSVLRVNTWD